MNKLIIIKDICKILISLLIIGTLLRSCANADIYRTWTEADIKNVIMNRWLDKYNGNREQMINYINNQSWVLELLHYINSYSQVTITFDNNRNTMYITMSNGTGKFSLANGSWNYGIQTTNASSTLKYYIVYFSNALSLQHQDRGSSSPSSYTMNQSYYYFSVPLYQGVNSNTIIKQAGSYSPSNFFEENYFSNIKWELIPNSSQQIAIPNKNETFYTLNKGTFTTSLATLQDSTYTNNILMSIYAYNGSDWENIKSMYLFDEEKEIISDKFPSTTTGDIMSSLIKVNSNIIPANCIISLTASPNSIIAQELGLTEIGQYFFITNSKTVITDNSLDIIATFSGDTDYSNEVNQAIANDQNNTNDENLQDIKDTINENNNWWKTQFDNLFTIDSGDMQDSLEKFAEDNKFSSGELQIAMLGLDQLNSNSGDFIISWDSYTPHMSINGATINQNNMIPSGEINFTKLERDYPRIHNIMVWERRIVGLALLLLLAHNLWKTLMHTLGIGMQVFDTEEEERERVAVTFDKNGKHTTTTRRVGNLTIRKVK